MVHVNINRSDFELSKAFYEMLGFRVHWPVPKTNTHEVANALGMPNYEVHGALMALQNAERSKVIDALERKSPKDDSPPYPNLYRPWLASVVVASSNIDKDYDFLVSKGVDVLSAPVNVHTSETNYARFFCFKDPDSTFLELVQVAAADEGQTR